MTTGKTTALIRWTFVGKVMSLLFNMLSRLVIAFLPRNKSLLISWLQYPSGVILEPPKIKSATVSTVSPSICHEVMVTWQHIKKHRHYFANKGPSNQSCGFSSSHAWMWELDYKQSWVLKNWCFWTVVLEKTLESHLDCKEIQPVNPKEDQSWVFIGRTDVEAETPILWSPDAKNRPIRKGPDAGKDWRQEEKGTTLWDGWIASLT